MVELCAVVLVELEFLLLVDGAFGHEAVHHGAWVGVEVSDHDNVGALLSPHHVVDLVDGHLIVAHDGVLDQGGEEVCLYELDVVVFRGPVEVCVGDKENLAGGLVFEHGDDGDGVSDIQPRLGVRGLIDDGGVLEVVGKVDLFEVEEVELAAVVEDGHAIHHVCTLFPVAWLGLCLEDGVIAKVFHGRLPVVVVDLVLHLLEAHDVGELG